ncbi:MAG: tetratricopeptide repeat protein [Rhodocyclaceae bacterium]|nr:tetratricopeptide repeat protein [Rhodocyclaceae bacterium]
MMPNRPFVAPSARAMLLISLWLSSASAAFAQVSAQPALAASVLFPSPAPAPQKVTPLTEAGQLERQGRYAEALVKIEGVIAAEPGEVRPRFLKGVILMNMNRQNDAIAQFETLRDEFPELPETYNNLAVLYMRQGRVEQARSTLEIAVRANPAYAVAHENLGDIYARMAAGEYAQAGGNAARKLQLVREIITPAPVIPAPAK